MTAYATKSFAALSAFVLAACIWAPTLSPSPDVATYTVAVVTAPEMA